MKLFFSIVGILVIVLLGYSSFGHQSPRYVMLAHEITAKTGKELKAQKNLYLVGTGGGMMDDIQMMAMSFNYYKEVDLKTGRDLLVYATNEYLSAINNNTEIRPYLHEYPFTAKNIEIRIFIYNSDRSELSIDKIDCITSRHGMLNYYIRSDASQAIYEESYEKAVQAISSEEIK